MKKEELWLKAEIDTLKSEKENLERTLEESVERIKEQDTKWQKLKEWLSYRMECYDNCLNENVIMSSEMEEVLCARYNQCYETIAQIEYIEKELEAEDE